MGYYSPFMLDLIPPAPGDSDHPFELADGWMAQRVPASEYPVPMADVTENMQADLDVFRESNIPTIFRTMRDRGIRLLRRPQVRWFAYDALRHLNFENIQQEKIHDKTDTKYPRNTATRTAFAMPECAADNLINTSRDDVAAIMSGLPKKEWEQPFETVWGELQRARDDFRATPTYITLSHLTETITTLMDRLCYVTQAELHTLFVDITQRIDADPSTYFVDQPNVIGQMTTFDNTTLLHRGVDPQDQRLEFYNSVWHRDQFGLGLGFLHAKKPNGELQHGHMREIW